MNQPSTPRRTFDETFKREALALLLKSGKSPKALAQELGISHWNLRDWKKCYGPPPAAPTPRSPLELEAENRALRREIETLRIQRDILKKTLGILSEPPANASNA